MCFNGFTSVEYIMTSGVPQGSSLGPLLFLVYMDNLLSSLTCPALAYADDLKIYLVISNTSDAILLQHNLDIIANWCVVNNLKLSIAKCCKVSYTRKNVPFPTNYNIMSYH